MTKQKYVSEDNRTGYKIGSTVELTVEELNKVPFNVKMRMMTPTVVKKPTTKKIKEEK